MSQTLPFEDWPDGGRPRTAASFCAVLEDRARRAGPAPPERGRGGRGAFLDERAAQPLAGGGRRRRLPLGPPRRRRAAPRAWTPWHRSTSGPTSIRPTATCSRSPGAAPTGSRADGSGYANLALAGDWIDTGLNAGLHRGGDARRAAGRERGARPSARRPHHRVPPDAGAPVAERRPGPTSPPPASDCGPGQRGGGGRAHARAGSGGCVRRCACPFPVNGAPPGAAPGLAGSSGPRRPAPPSEPTPRSGPGRPGASAPTPSGWSSSTPSGRGCSSTAPPRSPSRRSARPRRRQRRRPAARRAAALVLGPASAGATTTTSAWLHVLDGPAAAPARLRATDLVAHDGVGGARRGARPARPPVLDTSAARTSSEVRVTVVVPAGTAPGVVPRAPAGRRAP